MANTTLTKAQKEALKKAEAKAKAQKEAESKVEDYTSEAWTLEALRAELITRGFDDADVAEATEDDLRASLMEDDLENAGDEEPETKEESEDEDNGNDQSYDEKQDGNTGTVGQKSPETPVARTVANTSDYVPVVILKGYDAEIRGSVVIRQYDVDTHGADYAELAEQFATKYASRAVSVSEIKGFKVSARIFDIKTKTYRTDVTTFENTEFESAYAKFRSYSVKSNAVLTVA